LLELQDKAEIDTEILGDEQVKQKQLGLYKIEIIIPQVILIFETDILKHEPEEKLIEVQVIMKFI